MASLEFFALPVEQKSRLSRLFEDEDVWCVARLFPPELVEVGDAKILESLFSGDGKVPLTLKKGEVLTEIIIPKETLEGFSTYKKVANRESIDFPIVGHAFWGSRGEKSYRASFTAVDRKPVRVKIFKRSCIKRLSLLRRDKHLAKSQGLIQGLNFFRLLE